MNCIISSARRRQFFRRLTVTYIVPNVRVGVIVSTNKFWFSSVAFRIVSLKLTSCVVF
jgi:hypothetical protein